MHNLFLLNFFTRKHFGRSNIEDKGVSIFTVYNEQQVIVYT